VAGENLLSNPVGRLSMSIGRLFEIEGLTGNEKSFFEMASNKLPREFDPNPVGDPWPLEVLQAQGFTIEEVHRYLATFPPERQYKIPGNLKATGEGEGEEDLVQRRASPNWPAPRIFQRF
jgi:hypothetical protein